jgi:hypothetical protein
MAYNPLCILCENFAYFFAVKKINRKEIRKVFAKETQRLKINYNNYD